VSGVVFNIPLSRHGKVECIEIVSTASTHSTASTGRRACEKGLFWCASALSTATTRIARAAHAELFPVNLHTTHVRRMHARMGITARASLSLIQADTLSSTGYSIPRQRPLSRH
jgi:hypothetical protein